MDAEVVAQLLMRRLPAEAGPWHVEPDGDGVVVHAGRPYRIGPGGDVYGLMGALDALDAEQPGDFLREEILEALEQFGGVDR
jgi:hypothetical protein